MGKSGHRGQRRDGAQCKDPWKRPGQSRLEGARAGCATGVGVLGPGRVLLGPCGQQSWGWRVRKRLRVYQRGHRGSLVCRRREGIPGERAPEMGRDELRGPLKAFAKEDPPPGAVRGFPLGGWVFDRERLAWEGAYRASSRESGGHGAPGRERASCAPR